MRSRFCLQTFVALALLGLFLEQPASSRNGSPTLTTVEAKEYYRDLFKVERVTVAGRTEPDLSVEVGELPSDHLFDELVLTHRHLLAYALKLVQLTADQRATVLADPSFPDAFFAILREDLGFEDTFLEIVNRYLLAHDGRITDWTPVQTRDLSVGQLVQIAVRFVYPDVILEDGSFGAHICTSFNGLEDLEIRDPFAEALAYSAMVTEIYRDQSPLLAKISDSLEVAKGLGLSGEEAVVLSRVQGVVWGQLMMSPELLSSLQHESERSGHLLPLAIKWEE